MSRYELRTRHQGRVYIPLYPTSNILSGFAALPDSDCELYPPHKELPPFAFNKLPIEIRLTVWDLLLPAPRKVSIARQVFRPHAGPHLSVLLRLCPESRAHLLKKYFIYWQASTIFAPTPLFFSPTRDTPVLYFGSRIRSSIFGPLNIAMFHSIELHRPGCWDQVQKIELRDVLFTLPMKGMLLFETRDGPPRDSALSVFRNLKEIECPWPYIWDTKDEDAFKDDMATVFAKWRAKIQLVRKTWW